jgi:hypothetical protein
MMRRFTPTVMLGLALLSAGAVRAQETQAAPAPAQDVAPGAGHEGVVHVNAVKNPEMHAYRAIVAGLDKFDDEHALAPKVPKLLFKVSARNGAPLPGPLPGAKLTADDFDLPLPIDQTSALFTVPRSQQAWDSKAEFRLSRKRNEVKVMPWIRTPGVPDNQRRLGDLRLQCKVLIAVAKEEIPLWVDMLVDSLLLTRDWCSFFKDQDRQWSEQVPAELAAATLREGERTLALKVHGHEFELPLADPSWGNDAIVDLEFAPDVAKGVPTPASPAAQASTVPSEPHAGDGK